MIRHSGVLRPTLAAAFIAVAGCASGPAVPVAPPPQPVAAVGGAGLNLDLSPPAAAVRVSSNVTLTGRELGTMWTFENPPTDYWQTEYGFTASGEWLEHVRLSSVRFGEYCSASFVSGSGLALTNHHCARECIEQVSTKSEDLLVHGFRARSQREERECPELFLDQLVGIEDVTLRIRAAATGGSNEEIAEAIRGASRRIESECARQTGETCQVVALFQGGQYQLYRYHRYQPVKLVFAPELQAGFFGGDADNFTYPRYALDVSFVRAYEKDGRTPVSTPHHFGWRAEGADEDELVFVTGNPGSTSRLTTVSQLMYERVYRHPLNVQLLSGQRAMLEAWARTNPDSEAETRQDLFEIENSLKAYRGELEGLRDSMLVGIKLRWEHEFRAKIQADVATRREFGDLWDRIEEIQHRKLDISPALNATNLQNSFAPQFSYASMLVRYANALVQPEAERPDEFRGPSLRRTESALTSPSPVDAWLASLMLRNQLDLAATWLNPQHPLHRALFESGESVDQAVARLTRESHILDPAFRKKLMAAGADAILESDDPMIGYARLAIEIQPGLMAEWRRIQADETVQRQRLGRAHFAAFGASLPPDATFTLRISDGRVKRYEYNGTFAPPHTTFAGMYARAAEFGNVMPWKLPAAFAEATSRVRMTTPLDLVSTVDITGGNSGSPLIDSEGRIVGLVFDGNIEQLPNEFVFRTDTGGRTVAVHSAAIVEALRNIYDADALLRELVGGRTGTGARKQQ